MKKSIYNIAVTIAILLTPVLSFAQGSVVNMKNSPHDRSDTYTVYMTKLMNLTAEQEKALDGLNAVYEQEINDVIVEADQLDVEKFTSEMKQIYKKKRKRAKRYLSKYQLEIYDDLHIYLKYLRLQKYYDLDIR